MLLKHLLLNVLLDVYEDIIIELRSTVQYKAISEKEKFICDQISKLGRKNVKKLSSTSYQ